MRGLTMAFLSFGTTGFLAGFGRMGARVSSPKTPAKTTTATV
ncbi:hypothetical protein [Aquibium microcysteis]|nr:hypothetical protein [Aquibium microcysteis]